MWVQVLVLLPACCVIPGKPLALCGLQVQVDTIRPCVRLNPCFMDRGQWRWSQIWVEHPGSQEPEQRLSRRVGIWAFLRDVVWPPASVSPWEGRALGVEQRPRRVKGSARITQHPVYPRNQGLSGERFCDL